MTKLVAIWTRQYIREAELEDSERIYMSDERMANMVNRAYDAGFRDAAYADRYKVRKALEAAGLDPSKVKWPERDNG